MMRLATLLALLHCCDAFTLRVQPHTARALRAAPAVCAAEDEPKEAAALSDEQKEALRQIAQDFFPTDKSEVTRDIASPFAYGKVRTDYPVLKGFSDAELYEGMGDYVIPREPVVMPPVPLEARVYQVLIPLSAIYLAATLIPGSPFNNGGAPSA